VLYGVSGSVGDPGVLPSQLPLEEHGMLSEQLVDIAWVHAVG
jgi:hypothetical protein